MITLLASASISLAWASSLAMRFCNSDFSPS